MFKNNFCTVLAHMRERAMSSLYLCTTMFNYRKFFDIIINYDRFRVKVYMAFSAVNNKNVVEAFFTTHTFYYDCSNHETRHSLFQPLPAPFISPLLKYK